ncbi:Myb-like DNA-binding domain-containing protein [Spironucleus salmonicida]|uniref:Myb-like DNA-binding domain-containing protein n=1 Tax=Spironucleus salmonicida TaxID=348837 RepID=V6LS66_9EUKA|nr:Myb-like DNA-binding domain-containing protein [Spironucleus salmonicida]|eukprot:EST47103.1 Myb-like DNA-binding domain-containing protein [Spironucleus salmonicida]
MTMHAKWTLAEQQLLREAIKDQCHTMEIDWTQISLKIPGKTPRQCSIRYHNIEKFSIQSGFFSSSQKTKWTTFMDQKVINVAENSGRNWKLVSQELGLGVSIVKNRFYVLQRKQEQKIPQIGVQPVCLTYSPFVFDLLDI